MVIADSSAWIEFLRGTPSQVGRRLRAMLRAGEIVLLPDVVLQEVLQGARDPGHFMRLREQMEEVRPFVPQDPRALAQLAAWLYARCRWQGITLRSPNDALIAACAIESGEPLLHADVDFERIATVEPRLRFA
jgi:predicted nucleic acid-binding protein